MSQAQAMFRLFGAVLVGGFLMRSSAAAGVDAIGVEVGGLRSDKGQVVCSLFASADGYPKKEEKAIAHTKGTISERKATCGSRTGNLCAVGVSRRKF